MKSREHEDAVAWLLEWLMFGVDQSRFQVRVGAALTLDGSEPEPDLMVIAATRRGRITPSTAALAIEVSVASLRRDLNRKAALYAQAGVDEYWVFDVGGRRVVVHRIAARGQLRRTCASCGRAAGSPALQRACRSSPSTSCCAPPGLNLRPAPCRRRRRRSSPAPEPGGPTTTLLRPMSFYVTTPIYYVNAAPHLGHAYSTIAADVLARHMRQRGEDVFFLTGTDEHGEPVALAAEREGVTPQELVDRNAPRFKELAPQLNVSNDFFIRTSDPEHKAKVQEVLTRVRDNGHVYEGVYEGWYCPRCADFKTDAEAGEDNLCPIHRTPLTREKEDNYFFRLSAFQDDLLRLLDEQPDFVMPRHRYNEARSFIESGLQDVSLSRSTFTWGVPVPWDPEHVFYVWFDALLNYYTALSYAKPGEDLTERFWPAQFHIIGKDILKFHTVFWPAMLLAAGLPLPEHVFVHGFLLMASRRRRRRGGAELMKMSKSMGNVLDPFADHRRVRRRRAALLLHARRELRPGRRGLDGALRRASTSPSSPTTSATSRAARSRWSTATAAAPCRRAEPDPELAAEIDADGRPRSARCSTAPTSPARSTRSGSACAA